MSTDRTRASALVLALALGAAAGLAAGPVRAAEEPVLARAFEVRYRSIHDAADLVGELLSAEGSLTLKPQLKILVVEDHPGVLERVESLLRSFDLPPRNVEVTLNLFLGTKRAEEQAARAPARRSVVELAPLQFTKFASYESLGSRSVSGVEGAEVTANLSEDYRVTFTVEDVDERQRVVRFRAVTLQRIGRTLEGAERVENLYTAVMLVRAGQTHFIGAATDPQADRALFLAVQAQLR